MTLLLALACDSFVMQVSDRRLSRNRIPIPGEWNKAVVWCNIASIAYTGAAFRDGRGRKPVDGWIAETIGGASSVHELFGTIITAAEAWLKRSHTVHPQAFSIVGWMPQPDGAQIPYAGLISNFHDQHGNLRKVTREFNWVRVNRNARPAPSTFFFARTGATVSKEEYRIGFRGLKRVMRSGQDPARAADLLTAVIRLVASHDPTVGSEVMVTCIPRPKNDNQQVLLTSRTGRPALDNPSFFYRRPDGDNGVAFAPQMVCQYVIQSQQRITYLNDSGSDVDVLTSIQILPGHPMYRKRPKTS